MRIMGKVTACLVLLAAFLGLAPAQQSRDLILARSDATAGLPVYTGSHVLIVGINKYSSLPARAQLKYAVNDAKEFRQVLVDYYGFKDGDVKVLTDDQATLANIRAALADLADPSKVKADDRVLVYFSGHGQTVSDATGDKGYLIPSDAKVDIENPTPESFRSTCLPMQEVWDKLDPSPAKHIAVLADACFSGLLTKSRSLTDYSLSAYLTMPARQAITAGGRGQKTWESDAYKHGLFTYNVLQELKRRAKDKQQVFPMVELFAAVLDPVVQMSKGRQVPQYTPFYTEGQMLLFAGGDKPPTDVGPSDHGTDNPGVTPARISVTTSPAGATVWVDDEQVGPSPCGKDYPLTDKKKVHVKAHLDGYEDAERDVQLSPKKESKLSLKLKAVKTPGVQMARLSVTTDPSGATVYIDGANSGTTPARLDHDVTESSTVTVRVSLAGYEDQQRDLQLNPRKEIKVNFKLKKAEVPKQFAHLSIGSDPPGATVFVDGKNLGVTPYRLDREVTQAVQVTIRLELPGFEPQEQIATLDPANEGKLDLTLKKIPLPPALQIQPLTSLRASGRAREVRFSPDHQQVAVIGEDHSITVYDLGSGHQIKQVQEPKNAFVLITPDLQRLVFISLLDNGKKQWASVLVQNITDEKTGRVYSAGLPDATSMNYAWTDGSSLVLCGQGGTSAVVDSLDLQTGRAVAFGVPGRLTCGVTSSDSSIMAIFREVPSGTTATNLILLRGSDRTDQQQIPILDSDIGQQAFVSPSGDTVAVNTARRLNNSTAISKGLRVFDTQTGKPRFAEPHEVALGFVANGTRILAWSALQGGTLELLDSSTGLGLGKVASPRLWVSDDGQLGASQASDGSIAISTIKINPGP